LDVLLAYMNRTYDIFISYRRDGGEHLAGRVRDALIHRGYRVFMDVEDLKSGRFDDALFSIIDGVTDVIVILTPGCLDRCKNEDDWLRQEIRHAIDCKRNIVPVCARGFQMPLPQSLPADIADLPRYNALTSAHEMFEASIDKLVSVFLKANNTSATLATGREDSTSMVTSNDSQSCYEEPSDFIWFFKNVRPFSWCWSIVRSFDISLSRLSKVINAPYIVIFGRSVPLAICIAALCYIWLLKYFMRTRGHIGPDAYIFSSNAVLLVMGSILTFFNTVQPALVLLLAAAVQFTIPVVLTCMDGYEFSRGSYSTHLFIIMLLLTVSRLCKR
jgi:hypothetical protein